jgi:hypothetical protein
VENVPPAVREDDLVRRDEVQSHAARAQARQQDAHVRVALELR